MIALNLPFLHQILLKDDRNLKNKKDETGIAKTKPYMKVSDLVTIWSTPSCDLPRILTPQIRRAYFTQGSIVVLALFALNIAVSAPWAIWGLWAFITYHFLKIVFLTRSNEDIEKELHEDLVERQYQKAKKELEDYDDITKQNKDK